MSEIDNLYEGFKEEVDQTSQNAASRIAEALKQFTSILDNIGPQIDAYIQDKVNAGDPPSQDDFDELKEMVESEGIRRKTSNQEISETFYEALIERCGSKRAVNELIEHTYGSTDTSKMKALPLQERMVRVHRLLLEHREQLHTNPVLHTLIKNLIRQAEREVTAGEEEQKAFFRYGNLFGLLRMFMHADSAISTLDTIEYLINTL